MSGACAVDGCRTDTVLWTSGAERSMSGVTYSKESVGPSRMSGVLLGLICAFGVVALGRGCGHGAPAEGVCGLAGRLCAGVQ